ncbi:MAG: alpha/beta fold hydrolase [Chryseobacterium sp.]|uniref:alpha/beta hydrolase n=1 Tax=Chryseobacterium sp. TaxID=1871047 RepID=UPI00281E882C|nr:alpha/beta fold hydrolase [Chryseobacterium sp.]MDR2237659.1 alpha/beta fold hydrolase [Chryseobacterium sp.]
MKKTLTLFLIGLFSLLIAQDRKDLGNTFIKTLLVDKNAEKAHAYFDASIAGQIPVPQLKSVVDQLLGQLGPFKNVIEINHEDDKYYYYSEFEKSKLDILITFNEQNKMMGFVLVPHKIFDKADDKTSLKIKSGDIDLKGTLLVPDQNSKKKLVILVHGSGASDRDETIGDNKPFKDIADELFKNGIATYRYDKRTYSNAETLSPQFTPADETINDAVNAAAYFKNNESFKDYQIIILGHSLGAYLMPRIAEKTNASKYIFMAGNARPMQDLIVDQYEYIHKVNPAGLPEEEVGKIKKQVAFVNSGKLTVDTPDSELPLGLPAAYWKYLQAYHPLEEVKKIKSPMFFAQGGRDYQVTEKDFSLWKNTLKNNKSAVFKWYPFLSHLFIKGSGTPSPKDYTVKGNVDQEFLNDLIQFILK